ncbi:chromatin remodelling complex Rsc7/Swp82 subunit-domain-containing protein [Emericellopsis atlantica]|uniref:Chromatin remodelling complex Rsc7/Swp82 subunit-domain-containing protein n=1 Tax=Emericellopsis atlantica TaxID=2614577 RepID=A0A9P8CJW1_9HYPO|nr:chromatin remodelling complex Rsc7/Swp82 subunit-domain-containing protein [Emericellopsis atlantica]KAG9249733.1 chromatin remodelling complex Rsc7/Swp82 subunit-domain-containing protein [Emericellopsis atlantica]
MCLSSQDTSMPHQSAPAYIPPPALAAVPPKPTPTKSAVRALPTFRDHTTDQLNETSDEYIPRGIDELGEKKVMSNGVLLGGRTYRCRTFLVPNRGDKLFMLAAECARVLSYRDSYLLFNKNRSLYKILASQAEKDDLFEKEITPFSHCSRQVAIVTARSMFRQFGSKVVEGGCRVRDDYWEQHARMQGFTETDLAGEKRPGAAKDREAVEGQINGSCKERCIRAQ